MRGGGEASKGTKEKEEGKKGFREAGRQQGRGGQESRGREAETEGSRGRMKRC